MGVYNKTIITNAGINAIAQAIAESQTLAFKTAKTSSYAIPDGTNIRAMTSLQDIVQSVELPTPAVYNSNTVQVYARFSNTNIATEYYINTIGVYASLAGGAEFLFAVLTAITPDRQPVFNENSPTAFIYNIMMQIREAESITFAVNDTGTATVADLNRVAQPFSGATASAAGSGGRVPAPAAGDDGKFLRGDATWTAPADMVEAFTSSDVADGGATAWTGVNPLTSGETNKSIFAKLSQMFKNIRYLYKMLGTTDISSIGNGTVTGGLSSLNDSLSLAIKDESAQTIADANLMATNRKFTIGRYSADSRNTPYKAGLTGNLSEGAILNYGGWVSAGGFYASQMAMVNGGNIYERHCTNTQWSAWQKL